MAYGRISTVVVEELPPTPNGFVFLPPASTAPLLPTAIPPGGTATVVGLGGGRAADVVVVAPERDGDDDDEIPTTGRFVETFIIVVVVFFFFLGTMRIFGLDEDMMACSMLASLICA